MDRKSFIASKLMESWFPSSHRDKVWLSGPDGKSWLEIAEIDAEVADKAADEWQEKQNEDTEYDNNSYLKGYSNAKINILNSITSEISRHKKYLEELEDNKKAQAYQECINIVKSYK